jgi:poly(A) polymerase
VGTECATDRLLLDGRAGDAASVASWEMPRLPISGGELIGRGLQQGPAVARKLREIEDHWVDQGFPEGAAFERIVSEALSSD